MRLNSLFKEEHREFVQITLMMQREDGHSLLQRSRPNKKRHLAFNTRVTHVAENTVLEVNCRINGFFSQ